MAVARTLSPTKQAVILQQGAIAFSLGKNEAARDFFKEAFELNTENDEAREYYVASLFVTKDFETANTLITDSTDAFKRRAAQSDFLVSSVNNAREYSTLAKLYETRVSLDITNAQNWASLAFVYYQLKQNDKAIETLARAAKAVPTFATTAQCITKNLETGKEPSTGCEQKPAQ
jgi:tetratricopeptide (TPR) repeat protein